MIIPVSAVAPVVVVPPIVMPIGGSHGVNRVTMNNDRRGIIITRPDDHGGRAGRDVNRRRAADDHRRRHGKADADAEVDSRL